MGFTQQVLEGIISVAKALRGQDLEGEFREMEATVGQISGMKQYIIVCFYWTNYKKSEQRENTDSSHKNSDYCCAIGL